MTDNSEGMSFKWKEGYFWSNQISVLAGGPMEMRRTLHRNSYQRRRKKLGASVKSIRFRTKAEVGRIEKD